MRTLFKKSYVDIVENRVFTLVQFNYNIGQTFMKFKFTT